VVLDAAAEVLGAVRRQKTAEKRSMRARVARCTVVDAPARLEALRQAEGDLKDAGALDQLVLVEGDAPEVTVVLAAEEP
jgi:valyl-tRNA synthetase